MTPRRPHPLLVIACASLAIASGVGAAQAQDTTAEFHFANSTNASIRVEMFEGAGSDSFEPRVVPPQQETRISIPPGPRIFDLVAFKAWPPHTHRIGIDAIAGERTDFHLSPARMGLYLLEDKDNLSALAISPSALSAEEMFADKYPGGVLPGVEGVCQPPFDHWESLVLWTSAEHGQYYRRQADALCGADERDLFREDGPLLSHYLCDTGWAHCVRHPEGDFRVLPGERTSEVADTAMELARVDDPRAEFARTYTIVARTAPRQSGNMTAYISFRPDRRGIRCPEGYRLHYQGFCINIADELADDIAFGVRTVPPTP